MAGGVSFQPLTTLEWQDVYQKAKPSRLPWHNSSLSNACTQRQFQQINLQIEFFSLSSLLQVPVQIGNDKCLEGKVFFFKRFKTKNHRMLVRIYWQNSKSFHTESNSRCSCVQKRLAGYIKKTGCQTLSQCNVTSSSILKNKRHIIYG